jgi:hypothetical protein
MPSHFNEGNTIHQFKSGRQFDDVAGNPRFGCAACSARPWEPGAVPCRLVILDQGVRQAAKIQLAVLEAKAAEFVRPARVPARKNHPQ